MEGVGATLLVDVLACSGWTRDDTGKLHALDFGCYGFTIPSYLS